MIRRLRRWAEEWGRKALKDYQAGAPLSRAVGDAIAQAVKERDEPRAGIAQGCPNCDEVWPARLAEARGEITRLHVAYDRDVQVDQQQYADVLQHAADKQATSDEYERQRDEAREEIARLREALERLGDWRLNKAREHVEELRRFAQTKADHDFIDRFSGWLIFGDEVITEALRAGGQG